MFSWIRNRPVGVESLSLDEWTDCITNAVAETAKIECKSRIRIIRRLISDALFIQQAREGPITQIFADMTYNRIIRQVLFSYQCVGFRETEVQHGGVTRLEQIIRAHSPDRLAFNKLMQQLENIDGDASWQTDYPTSPFPELESEE